MLVITLLEQGGFYFNKNNQKGECYEKIETSHYSFYADSISCCTIGTIKHFNVS